MAKAMANLTEKPLVKNATRGPTLQCKIGLIDGGTDERPAKFLGSPPLWKIQLEI